MDILKSMKNLLKRRVIRYIVFVLFVSAFAHSCAKALTINDNLRTINDTYIKMFEDYAERSNYLNYVITSYYYNSGYNGYTDYYLCLTNEKIDVSNLLKLNTNCEKLYKYNGYSNNYSFVESSNENLILNNTVYYTGKVNYSKVKIEILFYIECGILLLMCFYIILKDLLRG